MPYETSYDAGLNPFVHDKVRGKWPRTTDFVFVCIAHAFKIDTIFIVTSYRMIATGLIGFVLYVLVTLTCVMPIIFLQSFLGQFSRTGFISVFRIAPIFKGIGFVSLVMNLATLTYYSIFAAVPLFFLFNTLRPTIPWSCEGIKSWLTIERNLTTPCEDHTNLTHYVQMEIPAIEFLRYHVNTRYFKEEIIIDGQFSWPLMMCTAIIWILVGVVMTRNFDIISKFLRYSCIFVCGVIVVFLLRFAFLPGAFIGLRKMLQPHLQRLAEAVYTIPVVALSTLGPGWGSILTMASFNKFKGNIFSFSWIICLAHFGIVVGLALTAVFAERFLRRDNPRFLYLDFYHSQWVEILTIPTTLTFVGMTRVLTLIFLSMMILGSMNLIIVQLLSVLTSLFDEYPRLRSLKMEVTLGSISFLAVVSLYSCHNHGIHFFALLSQFSVVTNVILNFLLLLVVLWIYGREKFQRDLKFMTERTYPTWMVNVVRFIAPISLSFVMIVGIRLAVYDFIRENDENSSTMGSLIFITLAPWILIPGYCGFKIMQTSGMLKVRLQRGFIPTDWYPGDPEDKQKYDEIFNRPEIGQQLTIVE